MDWKNKLFFGGNLGIRRTHVATESIDLIHLDPPALQLQRHLKRALQCKERRRIRHPNHRFLKPPGDGASESEAAYKEIVTCSLTVNPKSPGPRGIWLFKNQPGFRSRFFGQKSVSEWGYGFESFLRICPLAVTRMGGVPVIPSPFALHLRTALNGVKGLRVNSARNLLFPQRAAKQIFLPPCGIRMTEAA